MVHRRLLVSLMIVINTRAHAYLLCFGNVYTLLSPILNTVSDIYLSFLLTHGQPLHGLPSEALRAALSLLPVRLSLASSAPETVCKLAGAQYVFYSHIPFPLVLR